MSENEIWKDVVGYEGLYQVSDAGRVRSLDRVVEYSCGKLKPVRGRMLNLSKDAYGYRHVRLSNRHKRTTKVHSMVLEAFVGPRPAKYEACHCNGVPDDNRVENLRWDTASNNQKDRIAHGTDSRGEKSRRAKLTEEEVILIRRLSSVGVSRSSIAKRFNVHHSNVGKIVRREIWHHI